LLIPFADMRRQWSNHSSFLHCRNARSKRISQSSHRSHTLRDPLIHPRRFTNVSPSRTIHNRYPPLAAVEANSAGSAYSALDEIYKKIAYSFAIPTIVMLGVLYASVVARFIFFRVLRNSKHRYSHSLTGWAIWSGILALTWILAFVIAGVIPFFNDLLSTYSDHPSSSLRSQNLAFADRRPDEFFV